jgi:hypothetical protein
MQIIDAQKVGILHSLFSRLVSGKVMGLISRKVRFLTSFGRIGKVTE